MASLRRKPDVDAEVVADNNPPAVGVEADSTPGPPQELGSPRDDATLALQKQIDDLKKSETLQQQAQAMQVAKERRDAWLNSTPGARENISELSRIHHAALDAGLTDTSPAYFLFLESELAALSSKKPSALAEEMHARAERARTPEPPPRPSRIPFSAPVSREVPTADGPRSNRRVTLTPQEVEMARVSNITPEEYAKQKLKLQTMKATGEYSEQDNRR